MKLNRKLKRRKETENLRIWIVIVCVFAKFHMWMRVYYGSSMPVYSCSFNSIVNLIKIIRLEMSFLFLFQIFINSIDCMHAAQQVNASGCVMCIVIGSGLSI